MAINPININTILMQLQSSSSVLNVLNTTQDATTELLSNAANSQTAIASISDLATKINASYQAAQASGNSQTMQDFQSTMMNALNNPDPMQTINFITNISQMAQSDPSTFNNVLSTNGNLNSGQAENGTVTFNNLVNSLYQGLGSDAVNQLNTSVDSVNKADYAGSQVKLSDNLASLYNTYNQILNNDLTSGNATDLITALNTGLQQQQTGNSVSDFLVQFKNDNGLS
ncbi:MAG: hypothetical protein HQM09_06010 [Candidatus Riflebacteria bacterium]|nr:hypothetical protein [Candidatus Riflebacteria bacterium]